jgi:hypothetical protein
MARTILVKGNGNFLEGTLTAVAVPPGTLMERVGGASTFRAQSVAEAAGTYPEKLIAVENSLIGAEVGTSWEASSQCQMYKAQSGDVIHLRLEDSEVVALGDAVTANGTNGTMKKRDTGTNPPFAYALEAKDALSDAAASDLLVKCVIV